MNIITMEEEAFYRLVETVVKRVTDQYGQKALSKWVDGQEAMEILKIKSLTTLQKLRDTGAIRFSQPEKKLIVYDRDSLLAYIEKHVKEPFN